MRLGDHGEALASGPGCQDGDMTYVQQRCPLLPCGTGLGQGQEMGTAGCVALCPRALELAQQSLLSPRGHGKRGSCYMVTSSLPVYRNSLCSSGWPGTQDPPASADRLLGSQTRPLCPARA